MHATHYPTESSRGYCPRQTEDHPVKLHCWTSSHKIVFQLLLLAVHLGMGVVTVVLCWHAVERLPNEGGRVLFTGRTFIAILQKEESSASFFWRGPSKAVLCCLVANHLCWWSHFARLLQIGQFAIVMYQLLAILIVETVCPRSTIRREVNGMPRV